MPFSFFVLTATLAALGSAPAHAATSEVELEDLSTQIDASAQPELAQGEFKPQDPNKVDRKPGILHEPVIDEESSALALEDSSVLEEMSQSTSSED